MEDRCLNGMIDRDKDPAAGFDNGSLCLTKK